VLLGPEWDQVPSVLIWSALGLMIGTPIGIVASGYLYAIAEPRAVLRCVTAKSVAWLVLAFALVPSLGPEAVGIGWVAGGIVEAVAFGVALRRRTGARLARAAGLPLVLGLGAGGVGCLVATAGEPSLLLAGAAALTAFAVAAGGLRLLSRGMLAEAVRVARTGMERPPAPAAAS
jgi:O-antigen/teichoic acid export membrane protein